MCCASVGYGVEDEYVAVKSTAHVKPSSANAVAHWLYGSLPLNCIFDGPLFVELACRQTAADLPTAFTKARCEPAYYVCSWTVVLSMSNRLGGNGEQRVRSAVQIRRHT